MRALLVLVALLGCGTRPERFLRDRGRPEPIKCIADHSSYTCRDGSGVIWKCDCANNTCDSECFAIGTTPLESK